MRISDWSSDVCSSDLGLEALLRRPAELAGRLRGVDGVAQIVAGAVVDEGDQAAAGLAARARLQLVDQVADHADHRNVALFAVAADVVGLAGAALRDRKSTRLNSSH